MQNPEPPERTPMGLWSLVRGSVKNLPNGKWIFAPVALGAVGALVFGLFKSPQLAVAGSLFAFVFLLLFFLFSRGARAGARLTGPFMVLVWSVTGVVSITLVFLLTSVFLRWPLELSSWIVGEGGGGGPPGPAVKVVPQCEATASGDPEDGSQVCKARKTPVPLAKVSRFEVVCEAAEAAAGVVQVQAPTGFFVPADVEEGDGSKYWPRGRTIQQKGGLDFVTGAKFDVSLGKDDVLKFPMRLCHSGPAPKKLTITTGAAE